MTERLICVNTRQKSMLKTDYERAYNTAMRIKRLNNFTAEDFKRFGLDLPKVCRLQRALSDLPPDIAKIVYLEYIKDKE